MEKMLRKQICSIENAKKLATLGFKQQSLFYYVNKYRSPRGAEINDGEHVILGERKHLTRLAGRKRGTEVEFVCAYTLAELLIFSPYSFDTKEVKADRVAESLIEVVQDYNDLVLPKLNKNYIEHFELENVEFFFDEDSKIPKKTFDKLGKRLKG